LRGGVHRTRPPSAALPGAGWEENLIERAGTLSNGPEVTVGALPAPLRSPANVGPPGGGPLPASFSLEAHLAEVERELIERALSDRE
jgi:DNA-binding NtrC family response regulator